MAKTTPRQFHTQQVHFLYKVVNYNDTGIGTAGTGVYVGTIPAGSVIIGTDAFVTTAFNAATTNVLTLGTQATTTEVVSAAALNEGATGVTQNIPPNASPFLVDLAADQDIYCLYTQSGTAATAGRCVFVVKYVPAI
jgi:hypothetical protein